MCDKAVRDDVFSLVCVADWFVTQKQIGLWGDDNDYCDDDEIIKWYEGYKEHKAQKEKMERELSPLLGTHQGGGVGACQKMRKKGQKYCVEVTDSCF